MAQPWDLRGDDLDQWARTREAEAELPNLVRRLLLATVPLHSLQMRADSGVRLGGWDGVVRATWSSAHCPMGLSVWELSVRGDVKTKLDQDYEARRHSPGLNPSLATYVAVTGRRYAGKETWRRTREKEGVWRAVRVFDADDLATWLGEAPAVSRWLASLVGRPVQDLSDLGSLAQAWSRRTSPPLPPELLVQGTERQAAAEKLRRWASQELDRRPVGNGAPAPSPTLTVAADTRDEAAAFVAAALADSPAETRTLVALSPEALRWAAALSSARPLLLVPLFEAPLPPLAGSPTLLFVAEQPLGTASQGITVGELPFGRIEPLLENAGLSPGEAKRLARSSGGKLSALQRLLGYSSAPRWVEDAPANTLAALLLLGAWDPTNEADRAVVNDLGVHPRELEDLCERLSRTADAATVRDEERWGRAVWTWRAPKDAWASLADRVPGQTLRAFGETAERVLAASDPRFEVEADERFMAPVTGKVLQESPALRSGIASALAELAQRNAALERLHGPRAGSGMADRVIFSVLQPAWIAWASVSELLPVLAEAAPLHFLDALERSLRLEDAGVAHLLAEEGQWGSPHTGLLWALETLGWEPELMARVALALARLADFDRRFEGRSSRLSNRPESSLHHLLHPYAPMTLATTTERLRVLARIQEAEPEIGFRLLLRVLGERDGFMSLAPQPKFRAWEPLTFEDLVKRNWEGRAEFGQTSVEMAIKHAGLDATRWAGLVEVTHRLPSEWSLEVLRELLERVEAIRDEGLRIWSAVRERLYADAHSESGPGDLEIHQELEVLYSALEPPDPVTQVAWLFTQEAEHLPEPQHSELKGDPLPDWWQAQQDRIEEVRNARLLELWSKPDRLALLSRLVKAADPHTLAWSLGQAPFAEELESELLSGEAPAALREVVPRFVASRFYARNQDLTWLGETLRRLAEAGRGDDAVLAAVRVPPLPELWDFLAGLGEPISSGYWRQLLTSEGLVPKQQPERAIASMLAVGNVEGALRAAGRMRESLSASTALLVLEELKGSPKGLDILRRNSRVSYYVSRLFQALDRDTSLDTEQLASLELSFLSVLEHSRRPAHHLWRLIADKPLLFVELLSLCYRRDDEPDAAKVSVSTADGDSAPGDEAARETALKAYRILESWKGYPGEGLPLDERERKLDAWAQEVLRLAAGDSLAVPAAIGLGNVLARVPQAADGHWPCGAARGLLAQGVERFSLNLQIAKRNLRGVHGRSIGEGGRQERTIAAGFRASATALRSDYPHTAAMLDELVEDYERDAERVDAQARTELRRSGLEPQPVAPASTAVVSDPGSASRIEVAEGDGLAQPLRVTGLKVHGLRCLKAIDLDLGPLTVLIGENGSGKSSLIEACQLLHEAARPDFVDRLEAAHGGLGSLLGQGCPSLVLGFSARSEDRVLRYELELEREGNGTKVVRELLLLGEETDAEPQRPASRIIDRVGPKATFAGAPHPLDGLAARHLALHAFGQQVVPHPAIAWAHGVLEGLDVRAAFPVRAAWLSSGAPMPGPRTAKGPVRPARRLALDAGNLSDVWYALRHEHPSEHWEATLDYLRLGLGEEVADVRFPNLAANDDPTLAIKYRQWERPIPLSHLSDGTISFLAFVALTRLGGPRALFAFDEPEHHLHPTLLLRVLDFFETLSEEHPVLLCTHSDRLLDGLSEPAEAAVLCELEDGWTVLKRPDREVLDRWLAEFRGLGDLRAEGYEGSVMTREVAADGHQR